MHLYAGGGGLSIFDYMAHSLRSFADEPPVRSDLWGLIRLATDIKEKAAL